MRRPLALLMIAGVVAPAIVASAHFATAQEDGRVGIRLLEAPTDRADDPRARQYIVDHVQPGDEITRRVEVSNDTAEAKRIDLYASGAGIDDGQFTGAEGRTGNELSSWVTVSPTSVVVPPGEGGEATITIDVPAGAEPGERYAVVWAEPPAVTTESGVRLVNRVGIRIYLSVGEGAEPKTDFVIEELVAGREDDGFPYVQVQVVNTGERAIDLSGELRLENGPGSTSAGPFSVELGTTLAPGDRELATVVLDLETPAGPWDATITIISGETKRTATAAITFPEERGARAEAVEAREVTGTTRGLVSLAAAAGIFLAVLSGFLWFFLAKKRAR